MARQSGVKGERTGHKELAWLPCRQKSESLSSRQAWHFHDPETGRTSRHTDANTHKHNLRVMFSYRSSFSSLLTLLLARHRRNHAEVNGTLSFITCKKIADSKFFVNFLLYKDGLDFSSFLLFILFFFLREEGGFLSRCEDCLMGFVCSMFYILK